MICPKPDCPCLCDNPDLHHRLAAQGGSDEVNPDFCAGLRKTDQLVEERDRLRAELAALRASFDVERELLRSDHQALVERAVRATIEHLSGKHGGTQYVSEQLEIDPAPIVARVLGGGE